MNWKQNIAHFFSRGKRLFNGGSSQIPVGWGNISELQFADAVFYNLVELLTDLNHDVTWTFDGRNKPVEIAFIRFFNNYGKVVLTRLFKDGVCVIKHRQEGEGETAAHSFEIAIKNRDYSEHIENEWTTFTSNNPDVDIYAMRSATFQSLNRSDYQLVSPFLEYINNTMNASNTASARMGALVVCSPKNPSNSPMSVTLDEDEKKEIEEQMSKEYGALRSQRSVMVLPREMSWQVISLAQLDFKTIDKVKMAVAAIADRIKVPANQCALIDAASSKSLANGTELREGDFNKYQSYERLIDQTFVQFARDCKLSPVSPDSFYTIYNKPTQQTPQI